MEPLLYLVHRLPYPPNKGDKIRSYHLLRHLVQRYRVYLGTFIDEPADEPHVARLRELCAEVFAVRLSPLRAHARALLALLRGEALTAAVYRDARLQRWVQATLGGRSIERAVAFSSPMAQYLAGAPGVRLVADYCDVDSAKWSEYAPRHAWPMSAIYRREGRRLLDFERAHALRSQACVFATEAERRLFAGLAPECAGRTVAIGNGVDHDYFAPDPARASPFAAGEEAIVFTGAMDYWPNVDAVSWFTDAILPRLLERRPALRFTIVGMNPAPAVRALASRAAVTVTGQVEDVRPYLQHAAAVVAPMRIARGIQNKIIEAMAMGRPVVVAGDAALGLQAVAGRDFVAAAADAAAFADALLALLTRPDREEIGRRARVAVLAAYDWNRGLPAFSSLIEASARPAGGAQGPTPAPAPAPAPAAPDPAATAGAPARVSIIIPTTCLAVRRQQMERAVASAHEQEGVDPQIIVVVNGSDFDAAQFESLKRDPRVRVEYLAEANVSLARYRGLQAADGDFFAFLDDDDEFLPMALYKRAALLRRRPELDVLVTNGYRHDERDTVTVDADLERKIAENLPASFLHANWFASGAGTFRRDTVDAGLFDIRLKHFEWTNLFFSLLAAGKKIGYVGELTYRYYEASPSSVSHTDAYRAAYPPFLLELLAKPLDPELHKGIVRKYQTSLNGVSQMHLENGDIGLAAVAHWRSLAAGGWRFVPYTRKIALAAMRKALTNSAS